MGMWNSINIDKINQKWKLSFALKVDQIWQNVGHKQLPEWNNQGGSEIWRYTCFNPFLHVLRNSLTEIRQENFSENKWKRTLTDPGTELTQVRVRVPADSDSCGEFKITCGSTTQLPRPGASCLAYAARFADTALLRVAICLTRECVETTRAG